MKVCVINGSPKGKTSVTLHSVMYLQKHFSEWDFEVFHVGQKIKAIEKDATRFERIMDAVRVSDCVLWCYPVYTFLVPYQLLQFIDLVFQRNQGAVFAKKYASQISTSKHFYDHTAYNYIHNISEDLGMRHVHGHCADMDDLTTADGRKQLLLFGTDLFSTVGKGLPVSRKYTPSDSTVREYNAPGNLVDTEKSKDYRVVVITDCTSGDTNLLRMIDTYQKLLPHEVEIINIAEFSFQGGCLGCFNCAYEGECVYNDGFDDFHRQKVLEADCMILAATIQRHWFNPVWKCYDDRQFYNGHRTSMMGKSIGYIVSGTLRREANLREVLEARSEVSEQYLLDIVTDEYESDGDITALLGNLAEKTMWALKNKPQRPQNFFGVGGMKIFRDLIYVMRGLMPEDHRFYKEHGLYDFPQRQFGTLLKMQLIGLLMMSKNLRQKSKKTTNKMILKPYKDAIERY